MVLGDWLIRHPILPLCCITPTVLHALLQVFELHLLILIVGEKAKRQTSGVVQIQGKVEVQGLLCRFSQATRKVRDDYYWLRIFTPVVEGYM